MAPAVGWPTGGLNGSIPLHFHPFCRNGHNFSEREAILAACCLPSATGSGLAVSCGGPVLFSPVIVITHAPPCKAPAAQLPAADGAPGHRHGRARVTLLHGLTSASKTPGWGRCCREAVINQGKILTALNGSKFILAGGERLRKSLLPWSELLIWGVRIRFYLP